jgi:hypothetical protein
MEMIDAVRQLTRAICRHDFDGAAVAIDLLVRSQEADTYCDECGGGFSVEGLTEVVAIERALHDLHIKRDPPLPPLAVADVLPRPGHLPGSTDPKPVFAGEGA